jgi:hypothetical protein
MTRRAAHRAISAEESNDSGGYSIVPNNEILRLIIRYIILLAMATFCRGQTTLSARRKLEIIAYRCAPRREAHRDGVARKKGRRQYGLASGERTRMGVLLGRFYHLSFRVLHPDREPVGEPLIDRAQQRAT